MEIPSAAEFCLDSPKMSTVAIQETQNQVSCSCESILQNIKAYFDSAIQSYSNLTSTLLGSVFANIDSVNVKSETLAQTILSYVDESFVLQFAQIYGPLLALNVPGIDLTLEQSEFPPVESTKPNETPGGVTTGGIVPLKGESHGGTGSEIKEGLGEGSTKGIEEYPRGQSKGNRSDETGNHRNGPETKSVSGTYRGGAAFRGRIDSGTARGTQENASPGREGTTALPSINLSDVDSQTCQQLLQGATPIIVAGNVARDPVDLDQPHAMLFSGVDNPWIQRFNDYYSGAMDDIFNGMNSIELMKLRDNQEELP